MVTYLIAAAIAAGYWLATALGPPLVWAYRWYGFLLMLLFTFGGTLLFAFAYPRFLFDPSVDEKRRNTALRVVGVGAASTMIIFLIWPKYYAGDSHWQSFGEIAVNAIAIAALPGFVVTGIAGVFLLLRNRPTLTKFASAQFWMCLLLLAITFKAKQHFQSPLDGASYFFCLLAPFLFAFAAGVARFRRAFGHSMALLAGLMCVPWLWHEDFSQFRRAYAWLALNYADADPGILAFLCNKLTIPAVAFIVVATVTAALRLLPARWKVRDSQVREWNWAAYVAGFVVVAIWFSSAEIPYRPPFVDGDDIEGVVLNIEHVEKHGLQFHETSIRAWDGGRFEVSRSDQRLFQYRFQARVASGELSEVSMDRVRALVNSSIFRENPNARVKALRAWNADGWYVHGLHLPQLYYSTENGRQPPPEVVQLFHYLEQLTPEISKQREVKDVCLGFCVGQP